MFRSLSLSSRYVVVAVFLFCTAGIAFAGSLLGIDAYSTNLGVVDRDNGAWTPIGPAGAVITGMAYDSNHGILYGISPDADTLFGINEHTGAAYPLGSVGSLGYDNANGLAYDPLNDILYGTDNNTNDLFTVDPATGVAHRIATISGGFTEIEGLGFDPNTRTLYGLTQLQSRIVSIDVTTGVATAVSDELPSRVWRGLEWDSEWNVLYLSAVNIFQNAEIWNFNPDGGRLDFRGYSVGVEGIQGLAFIPEPSAVLLCLVAATVLARRR